MPPPERIEPRRRLSAAQIMGAVAVVSMIFGGVIGFFMSHDDGGLAATSRPIFVWGFLAVLAISCLVTIPYWRRLDEAAREAHKSAWIWGGGAAFTLAAAVGALLLLAPADVWLPSLSHRADGPGRFIDGVFFTVALQSLAYGLAWGIWWWRRR